MKQSTLGSCIRALRTQKQMTQVQLAERLGVTDKAVSKWERDLSYPDIALFPRLADVLGVTVNDLLWECKDDCHPSRLREAFEISRDIRTPLHMMLGFVEMARNNIDDRTTVLRYLEGIRVSGEYMVQLFDTFLRTGCCEGKDLFSDVYPFTPAVLEEYVQERMAGERETQEAYDFAGRRILIAEDMAINRAIADEILRQTGVETDFAEDGAECLAKVEAAPVGYYDLILMDIMMPEMDGLEATRRIRTLPDPQKAQIPIIAMTTCVSEQDRKAAFDAGMDAFTEKPIFVEKLFATIAPYLR